MVYTFKPFFSHSRARWFIRADDDVFVHSKKLLNFLSGINSRELHFIGNAGQGLNSEVGKLFLNWNQNYCMGGPGMIMSQPLLQLLLPKIEYCLANLLTMHEDVEVGRCVTFATGQNCTWAIDIRRLFYHRSGGVAVDKHGNEIKPNKINSIIIDDAITFHPIKNPENMEMHGFLLKSKHRGSLLSRAQNLTFKSTKQHCKNIKSFIRVKHSLDDLPWSEENWSFIYQKDWYNVGPDGPKGRLPSHLHQAIHHILKSMKINDWKFQAINYGFVNEDPCHGLTYILNLLFVNRKLMKRKKTMYVFIHQPLLDPLATALPDPSGRISIYIK